AGPQLHHSPRAQRAAQESSEIVVQGLPGGIGDRLVQSRSFRSCGRLITVRRGTWYIIHQLSYYVSQRPLLLREDFHGTEQRQRRGHLVRPADPSAVRGMLRALLRTGWT